MKRVKVSINDETSKVLERYDVSISKFINNTKMIDTNINIKLIDIINISKNLTQGK